MKLCRDLRYFLHFFVWTHLKIPLQIFPQFTRTKGKMICIFYYLPFALKVTAFYIFTVLKKVAALTQYLLEKNQIILFSHLVKDSHFAIYPFVWILLRKIIFIKIIESILNPKRLFPNWNAKMNNTNYFHKLNYFMIRFFDTNKSIMLYFLQTFLQKEYSTFLILKPYPF